MNDESVKRSIPLAPSGERTLNIHDTPPRQEEGKEIHPRRPLPPVPEAPPEDDGTP